MLPDIEFNGRSISFYAIAALVGILVVLAFILIYTKKKGHDEVFMLFLLLFGSIGIVIGGHLLYAITVFDRIIAFFQNIKTVNSFQLFIDWMVSIFGGSVFYGGLLGGMFAAWLYARKQKFDLDPYIGIGAICIPMFHTFGRIGCFLGGCCYGLPWEYGIDLAYSHAPGCAGVKRFPIQLVESLFCLILCLVLFYLFEKKHWKGKNILITYLLAYPIARFIIEFFRGDEYRGFFLGLSTSQIISVLIILITLGYIVYEKWFKKEKTPPVDGEIEAIS